jgi:hypothetical protein
MNQKQLVNFLSFWVANSVVLLASSVIFSGNVVLGNDKLSMPMAAVLSGLILTAIVLLVPTAVEKSGFKVKDKNIWAAIFLVTNVISLWIIKRLAIVTGLGISSIVWVLVLGIIITLAGWGVARATGSILKK